MNVALPVAPVAPTSPWLQPAGQRRSAAPPVTVIDTGADVVVRVAVVGGDGGQASRCRPARWSR